MTRVVGVRLRLATIPPRTSLTAVTVERRFAVGIEMELRRRRLTHLYRSLCEASPPIPMRDLFKPVVTTVVLAGLSLTGCANAPRQTTSSGTPSLSDRIPTQEWQTDSGLRPVSFHQRGEDSGAPGELALDTKNSTVAPITTELPVAESALLAEQSFDLETLVGMALSSNPAVGQAEAAAAQAAGIYRQVGLRPNPTVGYFAQEIGNDRAGGQHGLFASQTVVRGDKLPWNRRVAAHDLQRLKWETRAQRGRVETDVRVRFYRALAAQQKLRRAKEFRVDAAKAVAIAERRLQAKEGAKPDLLQSQLLVDEIDLSIRRSELDWRAAWAELAATIGQPSLQASGLTGDFVRADAIDVETLYQQTIAASPELGAATARINRAGANLSRQRNQAIQNWNVQFGLGFDDATDDPFANVQLGMPVPVHNRNQGNIAAARAEYAAACANLQRLKLRLRRDLADVYRRYQASAVAVEKYEQTMLPRAEESLALVEKARSAGELDFLRVLTARQSLFDLQQQLITARGELSQADAEITGYLLSNALGTDVTFDGEDGLRGQALSAQ